MGNYEVLTWQVLRMLHKSLSVYLGLFKLLGKGQRSPFPSSSRAGETPPSFRRWNVGVIRSVPE